MPNSLLHAPETGRFKLEELFFSRTDKRGVIQSANEVFRHVSFMEWDELINAPHKVVRHPLMPRAVFRVMWAAIQSGEPVGAYVVNQAKDNKCYWVYAVIMPLDDGYLSVRLKPTSERLEKIKDIYGRLRAAEDSGDQTLEESETALLAAIEELGMPDYRYFMTVSLMDEMTSRSLDLERGRIPALDALRDIETAVASVAKDAQTVSELFERTKQIPFNMRLQAVKLEGREGPISVISSNHQIMTQNLDGQVRELHQAAQLGAGPLRETQFVTGTTLLMEEVTRQFTREDQVDAQRRLSDTAALSTLSMSYDERARSALAETTLRARHLSSLCKSFKRVMSGLEMTRIMCKIEQSKLEDDASGLDEIAAQLLATEKNLSEVIARIETSVAAILDAVSLLDDMSKQAA